MNRNKFVRPRLKSNLKVGDYVYIVGPQAVDYKGCRGQIKALLPNGADVQINSGLNYFPYDQVGFSSRPKMGVGDRVRPVAMEYKPYPYWKDDLRGKVKSYYSDHVVVVEWDNRIEESACDVTWLAYE